MRTIVVGDDVRDALSGRLGGTLVYENRAGSRIAHSTFYGKVWVPAVERAGSEPIRVHDLRYSHAAYLISKGVPCWPVSQCLGHASINVTADVYAHLLPEVDDGIRKLLTPPKGPKK